jgi:hypothetical protein
MLSCWESRRERKRKGERNTDRLYRQVSLSTDLPLVVLIDLRHAVAVLFVQSGPLSLALHEELGLLDLLKLLNCAS